MPNSTRPVKRVKFSPSDTTIIEPTGGGGSKFFKPVDIEFKNNLVNQIESCIENQQSIIGVMVVELESKALAKSHRPIDVFDDSTCPFIGDIGIDIETKKGSFLVRTTINGLSSIKSKIVTTNAEYYEKALSTISRLYPFKPNINFQQISNETELIIELIDFKNETINEEKLRIYKSILDEEMIQSITLLEGKIFYVKIPNRNNTIEIIRKLENSNLLMDVKATKFINFQPLQLLENQISIELPTAEEDIDYPVVGVVDTCIKGDCPHISSWYEGEITSIIEDERVYDHGTFVAGLITNSFTLNSNDNHFPKSQSKVFSVGVLSSEGASIYETYNMLQRAQRQRPDIKIWNLSLGASEPVELTKISTFGIMLDKFQKDNNCICIIAAGNIDNPLDMRMWPPQDNEPKNIQRISSPGDSVLGITISSVAQIDGIVRRFEPSIFSRSGPVANYVLKPDLCHFGGNHIQNGQSLVSLGVTSLGMNSQASCAYGQDCGTSFATPLVSTIAANLWKRMGYDTPRHTIKGLLAHSARLRKKITKDEKLYYGWGMPLDVDSFMFCNKNEITIIMEGEIGSNREIVGKLPFPIPQSLRTEDGKVKAEFFMTTSYDPPLDENRAFEYCLVNIEAGLGEVNNEGNFFGKVPSEGTGYEQDLVNGSYKWSPIKVHHKKYPNGINVENWKLQVKMLTRQGFNPDRSFVQPFSIILTIRALDSEAQVYNEMVTLMDQYNWEVRNANIEIEERLQL
ncbi:MAG: S8 family peptidase [Aliarcobacter skirrowii]|uniref:S8 family peptidase n=1 Tax=Aliarcobacter skirrowii TaxID=28200 RepID=UPI00242B413A|nr:S8 family peptidase [Aliarcobacter skirrowii]MDD2509417.1 S8 family peptidase [Aliarcobacter skirrowii]MDD3497788.1 S8 family peptidase [Aliarcobacter skirrowii]